MKMIALRIVISDIYRDNVYEDDNDYGTNFSVFFLGPKFLPFIRCHCSLFQVRSAPPQTCSNQQLMFAPEGILG